MDCFDAKDLYISIVSETGEIIKNVSETSAPILGLAKVARDIPNLNIEFRDLKPSPQVLRNFCSEVPQLKGLFIHYNSYGYADYDLKVIAENLQLTPDLQVLELGLNNNRFESSGLGLETLMN